MKVDSIFQEIEEESATKINEFFATVASTLQGKIKKSKKTYVQYLPKLDSVPERKFKFHSLNFA